MPRLVMPLFAHVRRAGPGLHLLSSVPIFGDKARPENFLRRDRVPRDRVYTECKYRVPSEVCCGVAIDHEIGSIHYISPRYVPDVLERDTCTWCLHAYTHGNVLKVLALASIVQDEKDRCDGWHGGRLGFEGFWILWVNRVPA